ncbi:MAG: DUF1624 domain-containing protein [Lachnospiraceae bacterium]|nr:DUF1624 domain-containing protein [Lachnospiraceae bacterium]
MRYSILDRIRGLTVVSMILYHAVWDLVYIFAIDWTWYRSILAYVWQQSICWTFILLSGFCWSFGRKKWKRGFIVFAAGILITAVTLIFMPGQRIVFGILTCLGSCMLLMIPLEKILAKVPSIVGLLASVLLFMIFRNVNEGFLGFENFNFVKLPESLYQNKFMTYLGFMEDGFYSTDYFSLLPWLFLFVTGYFMYRLVKESGKLEKLATWNKTGSQERKKFHYLLTALEWIGRYSLLVYMVHQPIVYVVLWGVISIL